MARWTHARCGAPLDDDADACPAVRRSRRRHDRVVRAGQRRRAGARRASSPPAEGPLLVVRKGPDVGETLLPRPPAAHHRPRPESDIFLNDMTVSRTHARARRRGRRGRRSTDAGSLNGTYVNGVLVDRGRAAHAATRADRPLPDVLPRRGEAVAHGREDARLHDDRRGRRDARQAPSRPHASPRSASSRRRGSSRPSARRAATASSRRPTSRASS